MLKSSSFCSTKLDTNLVEPSLDIVLPVLVEVLVRHDIVPLCRHLLCNANIFEILVSGHRWDNIGR